MAGSKKSKIILISQAPGRIAHNKSIAWQDASGNKLREWLGVSNATFYNPNNFAILPMSFCYPGKAKTGDIPPLKICAPTWHQKVLTELERPNLNILIGKYAQDYYLKDQLNLTQRVRQLEKYLPEYLPLPHPSPTNRFWKAKNPWFETNMLTIIQQNIQSVLNE